MSEVMNNVCHFSENRQWRYSLVHRWDLDAPGADPGRKPRLLPWIGLNPSTADEQKLDPTLRRIRGFTKSIGIYDGFVMLNLFAWRDTDPKKMMRVMDPVGRENDTVIYMQAKEAGRVICAWGKHGGHVSRAKKVTAMLREAGAEMLCLGTNGDGTPKHPLYVPKETFLIPFGA